MLQLIQRTFATATIALLAVSCFGVTTTAALASTDNDGRSGWWHHSAQGGLSLKACRRATEKNPQDPVANNDLGWAYRQNGDNVHAEQYLRAAIKLKPGLAQSHSNLSVVLLDQNHVDEALTEAAQAITIDNKNPVFHVVLGNALTKKGDTKGAIEQYKAATKLKPDYENALYHLGVALADAGEKMEAKVALSQALGYDEKDDRVIRLLDQLSDAK